MAVSKDKPVIQVEHPEIDLIEPSGEVTLHELASNEKFMEELVQVRVHTVTDQNAPPYVILNCNGVNQPVARGTNQLIKRKFVEILARMKEVKYNQVQDNPNMPDDRRLVGNEGHCYPFEVIEDKNPLGRAWLSKIMAEAA